MYRHFNDVDIKETFLQNRKGPFKLFSPSMRRPNPIRSDQWNVIFLLFDVMADHISFGLENTFPNHPLQKKHKTKQKQNKEYECINMKSVFRISE